MPARIQGFCRRTGQSAPDGPGAVIRCALESLALRYRDPLEKLERIAGRRFQVMHIVGGGAQNRLLNQFTADALGIPVVTGPIEATATGSILVQAMADGELASLDEGRALVRASVELQTYEPRQTERWSEAYEAYRAITAAANSATTQ
jgi:rhamnulokinase